MHKHICYLSLTLAFLLPALSFGQGTITSNTGTFSLQTIPTSFVFDSVDANFIPNGGPDHVSEQWWWFRLAGDTRETPFNAGMGGFSQSYNGNMAVLTFNQPGVFSSEMRYTMLNVAVLEPGTASVLTQMRIANVSGAALTMSVFNYHDMDVFGPAGDSAVLQLPSMRIDDGGVLTHYGIYRGEGASAFRAGASGASEMGLFDGNLDNFVNEGLPFAAGNFSGGFQWNLNIPAGEIVTVNASFAIAAVPEPSSILLIGGSVMTASWVAYRRQRQARSQ